MGHVGTQAPPNQPIERRGTGTRGYRTISRTVTAKKKLTMGLSPPAKGRVPRRSGGESTTPGHSVASRMQVRVFREGRPQPADTARHRSGNSLHAHAFRGSRQQPVETTDTQRERCMLGLLTTDARRIPVRSLYRCSRTRRPNNADGKNQPDKQKRQSREQRRRAHGLQISTGFVKRHTKVLRSDGPVSRDDFIFHGIPQCVPRNFSSSLFDRLRDLENNVFPSAVLASHWFAESTHKYGANGGINLGNRIVTGGRHASKSTGVSGSIHPCPMARNSPAEYASMISLLRGILEDCYGSCLWYKRLCRLCEHLNDESTEPRTLPGLPVSGVWYSTKTRKEKIHVDRNICGAIFTFSTYAVRGKAKLAILAPGGGLLRTFDLSPRSVLGGRWGSSPHCNVNVDAHVTSTRTSWTLYLDAKVFSAKYKYIDHWRNDTVSESVRELQNSGARSAT